MGRKKKEEPFDENAPLKKCYDCFHWHMCRNGNNNDDAVDFSTGRCDRNGYSKVPPLFTCPGWASWKGEIADTLSLLMSN